MGTPDPGLGRNSIAKCVTELAQYYCTMAGEFRQWGKSLEAEHGVLQPAGLLEY